MTGPLAQQFAQVREESALLADWAEEPLGMGSVDVDNVRGRLLKALSSIERHVQDMEKALACEHHDTAWTFIEYEGESWNACQDCGLLEKWAGGQRFAQRVDPAALPAREKGEK